MIEKKRYWERCIDLRSVRIYLSYLSKIWIIARRNMRAIVEGYNPTSTTPPREFEPSVEIKRGVFMVRWCRRDSSFRLWEWCWISSRIREGCCLMYSSKDAGWEWIDWGILWLIFIQNELLLYFLVGKLSVGIISHFCSVALSIWKVEALTVDVDHCLFPWVVCS